MMDIYEVVVRTRGHHTVYVDDPEGMGQAWAEENAFDRLYESDLFEDLDIYDVEVRVLSDSESNE